MTITEAWGDGKPALPKELVRMYRAALSLKRSTATGATWAALRIFIISKGGRIDLGGSGLEDLVVRSKALVRGGGYNAVRKERARKRERKSKIS
jgi:hypothetical protein